MSCLFKIKNSMNNFSKSEKKIAEYILNNSEYVKTITSTQLAEASKVGQASVIRFVKKIGFKGFSEFKIKLNQELAALTDKKNILHSSVTLQDSIEEITKKIAEDSIDSINITQQNLKETELKKAVKLLKNAEKIILIGMGASSLVAKDFSYKLSKIGKVAIHNTDSDVQLTNVINSNKKDLIIAISQSGEKKEILKSLEEAKKNKTPVIGITGKAGSSIEEYSDITLYSYAHEGLLRSSPMTSRITQLFLIDSLFVGLVQSNPDEILSLIERCRKSIIEF